VRSTTLSEHPLPERASSRYQGQAHQGRLSNLPGDATGDGHEECGPGRLEEANVGSVPWIARLSDWDSPFTYITYNILCVCIYIYKHYIIYIYNISDNTHIYIYAYLSIFVYYTYVQFLDILAIICNNEAKWLAGITVETIFLYRQGLQSKNPLPNWWN
jgi:hypothetical protein